MTAPLRLGDDLVAVEPAFACGATVPAMALDPQSVHGVLTAALERLQAQRVYGLRTYELLDDRCSPRGTLTGDQRLIRAEAWIEGHDAAVGQLEALLEDLTGIEVRPADPRDLGPTAVELTLFPA